MLGERYVACRLAGAGRWQNCNNGHGTIRGVRCYARGRVMGRLVYRSRVRGCRCRGGGRCRGRPPGLRRIPGSCHMSARERSTQGRAGTCPGAMSGCLRTRPGRRRLWAHPAGGCRWIAGPSGVLVCDCGGGPLGQGSRIAGRSAGPLVPSYGACPMPLTVRSQLRWRFLYARRASSSGVGFWKKAIQGFIAASEIRKLPCGAREFLSLSRFSNSSSGASR